MIKFIKFDLVSYEDAKKFGRNNENREIKSRTHLQKIKKQCLTSMEAMPPITVNVRTNHVIDGQHRLEAYKNLVAEGLLGEDVKLKVMYVDMPIEEEKQAIIDANTNSKNWSLDDYIDSYSKAGVISYVTLENWCKMHPLCTENGKAKYRYGASIIKGKRCSTELKLGEFKVTQEEMARADDIHAEMLEIVELFGMKGKGNWIESLAVSWVGVRNQHDFRTWMKELKSKKSRFMKLPKDNSKDWDSIFGQAHLAIDKKRED